MIYNKLKFFLPITFILI